MKENKLTTPSVLKKENIMNYNEIIEQFQKNENIHHLATMRVMRNLGLDEEPQFNDEFNDLVHEMILEIKKEEENS